MLKHLKQNKRTVPGEVIDLFKDDSETKYLILTKKIHSLQKEKLRMQIALQNYEDVYNSSACGYHCLNANGVFIRMNNTELKWLGYSSEELLGNKKLIDILSPGDIARYRKNLIDLKKIGYLNEVYNFIRKDNSVMPMRVNSIAVYDKKGKFKTSCATVFHLAGKDLTDHVSSQTNKDLKTENIELQQANIEMSVLNEAKDRFIGIAYHDLQNPLAAIMLMSKMLLGDQHPELLEKHKEKYQAIYEASLQMNELIKNYLNVNRIETGSIVPSLSKVDIVKITQGIITRYEEVSQRKEIPIFFTSPRRTIILTDAECYSQIIENVLSNAIKYTPPGKSIFVKIDSKGNDVFIAIEDEGVGMREDEIPLLYGKFQTLSSKPTGGELSTGLGLSIVRFLVDQLKGSIAVKSRLGKGTRFTLCFSKNLKLNSPHEMVSKEHVV